MLPRRKISSVYEDSNSCSDSQDNNSANHSSDFQSSSLGANGSTEVNLSTNRRVQTSLRLPSHRVEPGSPHGGSTSTYKTRMSTNNVRKRVLASRIQLFNRDSNLQNAANSPGADVTDNDS